MIWTERVHQLVEDIIKLISKGVMEFSDTDCVIMPTDKDIKWQEIQEVVKFFRAKVLKLLGIRRQIMYLFLHLLLW